MTIPDGSPVVASERKFIGATAGAAVLAAVLALALRWDQGLSGGAPYMANTARLPWPDLFTVFRTDTVPLSYAVVRAWTSLFGETELALRALSTTAFAGAVVATGRAAAVGGGWSAGAFAALLMATSVQVGLLHAATARPYALLGLITAVAGLEVVQLVTRPDQDTWRLGARTMLRIALVHLAGLFTHPTYAFVLGATTLAALVHGGTARPVAAWAGSLAAAVYAVTWWPALHTTTGSAATASIGPPVLADLGTTLQILWGSLPGLLVLLSVAAFSALRLRESRGMPPAPALRAMMIVAVTVLVAPFVASSWLAVFVPSGIAVLLLPSACVCVALLVVPRGNAIVMGALAAALLTSAIVQVAHS